MEFQSFGKVAIKPDQTDAFLKEGKTIGLTIKHLQANIYEFGITLPTLLEEGQLRQKAGMLGLKYSAE